jgi:hypothetical protein
MIPALSFRVQPGPGPVLVTVPQSLCIDLELACDGRIGILWMWLVLPAMRLAYE